uniref:FXYD domain-containing ion transport regulator n=1 Tax=Amphilophus citrinellus TaxID=61819 RepID=A0A3Q0SL92_AMPCI
PTHLTLCAFCVCVIVTLFYPYTSLGFFQYYERLRIGGLIFASLLIAGGIGVLVCKKWTDNSSEI